MKSAIEPRKALMPMLLGMLLVAIAAMVLLRGCSSPLTNIADEDNLRKSGGDTLDVAIDYSPMSIYAQGDSVGGLNHDLMISVAGCAHLPVKLHPFTSLDSALRLLDRGLFDIVVTDAPVTLDFKRQYLFTEPLYLDRQVLVSYSGDSIETESVNSQLDLARLNVWVVDGSPTESRLRNLMAEIGDTIFINSDPQYGAELLFLMTSIGEIKHCVINEAVAKAMLAKGGDAAISTNVSFTQFQGWILRSDSKQLKQRIDSAIIEYRLMESYPKLCSRYNVSPIE